MTPKASLQTAAREHLAQLTTERQNTASSDLDTKSALEIAQIMNAEDRKVPEAVGQALGKIAVAIDAITDALRRGGRLIYVGAGTSGRIAALDASECPPTFGISPERVQYIMAGGEKALGRAAEYNEDSRAAGAADMAKRKPGKRDVVVGIAASGRTPYTIAAVEHARKRGAKTVAVTCNANSELGCAGFPYAIASYEVEGKGFNWKSSEARATRVKHEEIPLEDEVVGFPAVAP